MNGLPVKPATTSRRSASSEGEVKSRTSVGNKQKQIRGGASLLHALWTLLEGGTTTSTGIKRGVTTELPPPDRKKEADYVPEGKSW